MMLMTPLTRGSRTKLRPVISATAFTTASISALTKLRVTGSSAPFAPEASRAARAAAARKRRDGEIIEPRMAPARLYATAPRGWAMIACALEPPFPAGEHAMRLNPLARFAASKVQANPRKENDMSHAATASGASMRARAAALALAVLAAIALASVPRPVRAADPAPGSETTVTLRAFPPALLVNTAAAKDEDSESTRKPSSLRFDTDDDFETISEKMPWVIGLIFLVVG